jgi:hypothetical protein
MTGYSVYLDDSGHPIDKPYLVLGGFIAREDRWVDFEQPRNDVLRERKIDFPFHATDFFKERRNDPKLKHIVADLVRVITNHIEAAFSVTIDVNVYDELNRERRLEEFSGTPYALITRAIHHTIDDWQKVVGPRRPLLHFVEDGTLHKGDMMDCLRDRDGINPPIPVKKDNVACQVADLYAYSVYQTAIKGGEPSLGFRYFMDKLPHTNERVDTKIFRPELESYVAKATAVLVSDKYPKGVRVKIPSREESDGWKFNFRGNLKKIRKPKLAVLKEPKQGGS